MVWLLIIEKLPSQGGPNSDKNDESDQNGQDSDDSVDSDEIPTLSKSSFKVEWFKEGCCISDENQK